MEIEKELDAFYEDVDELTKKYHHLTRCPEMADFFLGVGTSLTFANFSNQSDMKKFINSVVGHYLEYCRSRLEEFEVDV